MSNDVRGLLQGAAMVPAMEANVAAAWSRGRRLRARRIVASGVAIVAVVALASVATAKVLENGNGTTPVAPVTTGTPAPANCLATNSVVPSWADSANPPLSIPHVLTRDGNVLAFIFSDPMIAGHRSDRQNKILWIVRQPRGGKPLVVTGTLAGADVDPVHLSVPADSSPGEIYPSVVDVPKPGCWHFELAWNGHHSEIDLGYGSLDTPDTTTTTSTTTSTTTGSVAAGMCHTSGLDITIGDGSGAAGTEYYEISFRNVGTKPCVLNGYPGVSFVDSVGHQIGAPAARNDVAHTPTTIAPGATGYAALGVGNPSNFNCPVSTPAQVRVYPPNETVAAFLPAKGIRFCANVQGGGSGSSINPVIDHPLG
jgi:Protein of unknown function (DUF4232)